MLGFSFCVCALLFSFAKMRFVVEKKNWLACGCDVAQKTTELVTNPKALKMPKKFTGTSYRSHVRGAPHPTAQHRQGEIETVFIVKKNPNHDEKRKNLGFKKKKRECRNDANQHHERERQKKSTRRSRTLLLLPLLPPHRLRRPRHQQNQRLVPKNQHKKNQRPSPVQRRPL